MLGLRHLKEPGDSCCLSAAEQLSPLREEARDKQGRLVIASLMLWWPVPAELDDSPPPVCCLSEIKTDAADSASSSARELCTGERLTSFLKSL